MKTRFETMTAGGVDGYNNFCGKDDDYKDWFNVIGQHRDSDALSRSNFRCALKILGGEGNNVRVERFGHWACGWLEEVYVKPGTPECEKSKELERLLENYPFLDYEDFSSEEQTEANEVWRSCYRTSDRVEYIRKHQNQFDFNDFADMLGCVRGKYFNGDASELLN